MAESVNALYKTELHRNPAALTANGGHWKGLDDLEVATCAWVSWFNEPPARGARRPNAGRGRSRVLPCAVSGHRGMREPTARVSVKPRPSHNRDLCHCR